MCTQDYGYSSKEDRLNFSMIWCFSFAFCAYVVRVPDGRQPRGVCLPDPS